MKTRCLFRHTVNRMLFIVVILLSAFFANAQCPTISNSNPPPICDASGFSFNDLNTFATDNGSGIVWYNAASGGSAFNGTQLVSEGTYYADDNSGTCGSRSSITINFQINEVTQSLDGIYCSNENPTIQSYINEVLQPNIPIGGSVTVFNDLSLTNQANSTDSLPDGATNYYIVFSDVNGCESQIIVGSTAVFDAPDDPMPNSNQQFCTIDSPTVADLDAGTTENVSWYANIDGSGDPIPPALSNNTQLISGTTYYVQVNAIFCVSNTMETLVSIDIPFNPGSSAVLEYCEGSLPTTDVNLFDELEDFPDNNGSWSGPLTTSNGHLGTINISNFTDGNYVFTYTVPSNGSCPEGNASVTINVNQSLTSGTPSNLNPITFCESNLPSSFDLHTLLEGEDPNGQWTQGTNSTDSSVISPIDLTGFTAGIYNFTYTQNGAPNPCPEESTVVEISILVDPNAGNTINAVVCENDLSSNSPFDLFNALDGTQDNNNGIWTDVNNTTVSNTIDITNFTVENSPYQFTYTLSNGTCEDSETINITVEEAPESGEAIAPIEICEDALPVNSPFDLFTLLDGTQDTNGTWSDVNGIVSNPIDISTLTTGTYDFTYSVEDIGTCSDVDVIVQIIVLPKPETGTPTPALFCENDLTANSPLDLFEQLAGEDAGGTWLDDNSSGALTVNNVDLTILTIGVYNFSYTITNANGCTNTSTVTITIEDAPESGIPNAPIQFCLVEISSGQTYNLFDLLEGEDQSGTWTDNTPTSQLSGSILTLEALNEGTYTFTYNVDAIGTCNDELVNVSVIINNTTTPTVASAQEFCDTATIADLSATGTNIQWYDQPNNGNVLELATELVNGVTYYATQTDATTGCESSTRAAVTVTINLSPNSGNPNASGISVCNDNNSIDLNTGLDGSQDSGGIWQDTDNTGGLAQNIFDATGLAAGTYNFTYLVTGSAPCADSSTVIQVTLSEPLNPGTDAVLNVCSTNGTTDLFTLLGTADDGGTWSPALTSGTGIFDPLVDVSNTYTYVLSNSCGNYTSEVEVTVTQAPNAGTDGTFTICAIDIDTTNNQLDLLTVLNDTPDITGTFTNNNNAAGFSGTILDLTQVTAGTYNFTYTITANSPCTVNATAIATVVINDSVAPIIIESNPSFCLVDNPQVSDLDNSISGTEIKWYDDAALTLLLDASEELIDGEDYYATQTGTSACQSSTSVVINVTINDEATPTLIDSNLELCINDIPTVNDLTLNISEYEENSNNIVWYTTATGGTAISDSNFLNAGTTYFAAIINAVTGCESSVRLEVIPDLTGCGTLIIPDGFSPNGDGTNDTFNIDNLEVLYPNYEIEIYNRYGNSVFKGNAASPSFDGTSNESGTLGNGDLPVGVYFYIFNFNDGVNQPKQGRLYLSR